MNGMIGSLPLVSWAERDQPGIRLITEQADLHKRPPQVRNNYYTLAWASTDLFIETYIQTGNRVGFDHITGAEMKKTLENMVYAPLGGVEKIDYQGGARRTLSADRIGQMNYLGQDGKTPAGPDNPPMLVTVGDDKQMVPMLLPLSDFQTAPDLRPGGNDVRLLPAATSMSVPLGVVEGTIAFQSNRDGNNEIYIMNGDGSGLTNLTNNPADDIGPVWSPDGKKILFLSSRDGNYEVYLMNADGSDPTNLTNSPAFEGDNGGPEAIDWSPDGRKIAFTSDRNGNNEIYVMNADGSDPTNLTDSPTDEIFPKWSADGTQIGFTTNRAGNNDEIFLMNADGSKPTRLTNNSGDDAFPRW